VYLSLVCFTQKTKCGVTKNNILIEKSKELVGKRIKYERMGGKVHKGMKK
jgi:hypothetical protein